jgi:23S rRNA (adenine2503-C2)-methyltransferase
MTVDDIYDIISSSGYDKSHALTVLRGIYRKRNRSVNDITGIGKKLKLLLGDKTIPGVFLPENFQTSSDGTVKYLFRSPDGKVFETVYLPESKRKTVCISTQSGCRMGCPFCATAAYGFHGNLSAGEIVNQVFSIPCSEQIDHVVFMGMGEPMDNLEEVLTACRILTSEWGFAISPANVTVSTVGVTPSIESFLERSSCNLAVSLFSPFREERRKVIPAEKKYPVHEIIDILKGYPQSKRRRISMAYVMIAGVNDSESHLEALKNLFAGTAIRINLLPYHPGPGDNMKSSTGEVMMYFKHNLVLSGISASIRKSRGSDISAACGLLASGFKEG